MPLQNEQLDEESRIIAVVDFFFMAYDGGRFKVSLPFQPYFCVAAMEGATHEVASFISKKYHGVVARTEVIDKEDLDLVCCSQMSYFAHFYRITI